MIRYTHIIRLSSGEQEEARNGSPGCAVPEGGLSIPGLMLRDGRAAPPATSLPPWSRPHPRRPPASHAPDHPRLTARRLGDTPPRRRPVITWARNPAPRCAAGPARVVKLIDRDCLPLTTKRRDGSGREGTRGRGPSGAVRHAALEGSCRCLPAALQRTPGCDNPVLPRLRSELESARTDVPVIAD